MVNLNFKLQRVISVLNKICIKGMSEIELQTWCLELGQSKYRGKQLYEWMYRHGIVSFEKMTSISKTFQDYIKENCIICTLHVEKIIPSNIDESIKILFRTHDENFIETVSMIDGDRHTVCISSQVGCGLDCKFCETGRMGLKRNLSAGEIVDQLLFVKNYQTQLITNVVFMGMGEPFHNYENVINASNIFHSPFGFNLAASRITISTVGILPQIKKFINEKHKYKLAISLNASNDLVRSKIMPINKKWKIEDLIMVGKEYSKLKKRQVMFEYVLLKDINDSEDDAHQLANLLKDVSCKLNIIPYNETEGCFQRTEEENIMRFSKILHNYRGKFRVLIRWSKGQDINAGCGQLAVQNA